MRSAEDKRIIEELSRSAKQILSTQLLPFWSSMRDDNYGGYYGRMDHELVLHKDTDKGVILHSRILYFFSEYVNISKDMRYLSEAEHAYDFIMQHCFDKENGGVYWSVTQDGRPSDTTKHTYVQAFAIYALSSYYLLTGNKNAIEAAMELFYIIEKKCTDADGYLEAFDRNWKPVVNQKLSENNVIAYRTMNTLLHIFEAYSYLYKNTHSVKVENAMLRILDIYRSKVYNSSRKRQEVFFDKDYNSIIDLHSFGHDIESSWLIDSGCDELPYSELTEEIRCINTSIAEQICDEAYRDFSLFNECENGIIDTDRIWWVQCEAVIGFINLWQKSNDKKYLDAANKIWHYIQENIVDKREGSEWFWGVHENGSPMEGIDIAGDWKCPYHNGRMCFEIIRRAYEIT